MTADEELKILNSQIANEFKRFDELSREIAKRTKQRMARLYERQRVLWSKVIHAVKRNVNG